MPDRPLSVDDLRELYPISTENIASAVGRDGPVFRVPAPMPHRHTPATQMEGVPRPSPRQETINRIIKSMEHLQKVRAAVGKEYADGLSLLDILLDTLKYSISTETPSYFAKAILSVKTGGRADEQ